MTKKIRIMHVNGWLDVGGIEEVLLITAKFNLREKYDLAFVSYRRNDGYTGLELQKLGYPVYDLNLSSAMYDARIIFSLVKIFRNYRPHIVHFYQKSSFLGRIAAKIANVPIILCNEMDLNYQHEGMAGMVIKYLRKIPNIITDRVIVCSEAVRRYWDRRNTEKYMVIYIPFDSSEAQAMAFSKPIIPQHTFRNQRGPVIGTVSRIRPEKGHKYLIQAMPMIVKAFPSVRLKIVGSGSLLGEMKSLASELGLDEVIEFRGFVEDLQNELSSMDVFVLPSLTEGFPISLLEAMAAGLPVAASAVGGVPELVENGKSGLLFPPRNPEKTARSVIEILTDRKKAEEMGGYGQKLVTVNFSPQIYIDKLGKLYDELLRSKGINLQS